MKTRFIKSIVKTARATRAPLPWERGMPRAGMIARRKDAPEAPRKRA